MAKPTVGGTFNDILSATSLLYSPSAVNTTTQYRRLAVSTFNSVVCTMTSNIVELTVSGGAAPSANITTGNANNVHCDDADIILDASTTTGALSYAFTLNGVQQSGMPTSTASYTFAMGVISHGDSIGVIAYSGAGGTGCTDSASVTISLNTISSTNTVTNAQTICSGDDPTILNGSPMSSDLGGTISFSGKVEQVLILMSTSLELQGKTMTLQP